MKKIIFLIILLISVTCINCNTESSTEPNQKGGSEVISGYYPNISPNGTKIVYIQGGVIFICDTSGLNKIQLTSTIKEDMLPKWPPDGNRIGFIRQTNPPNRYGALMVIDVTTKEEISVLPSFTLDADSKSEWDWSPDGKTIAFIHQDSPYKSLIVCVSNGSGEILKSIPATEFTWSPDGKTIGYINANSIDSCSLFITYLDKDSTINICKNTRMYFPQWMPNGSTLLFVRNNQLVLIDLNTKHEIIFPNSCNPLTLKVSHRDKFIAFIDWTSASSPYSNDIYSLKTINISDSTLTNMASYTHNTYDSRNDFFVWAPSSKEIFYCWSGKILKVIVKQ